MAQAAALKNKAKSRRHEEELDAAQNEALSHQFRNFLRNGSGREWFDKSRKRLLRRGGED